MPRIIFVIAVFLFSLSSVMGQMIPVNLPADGNWPTIVGDSIMIIGPRQNELTEEQRYFNPVYLMTYPGKEHLKAQMIRAGACDCDPTKPNRRIGVFSVAPDKKVSFSQGNLQYLPAIKLWKFADTQYEYLGNANKYLKPTFRNWVDLFGWSANNTTAPFGVSTSTNVADYAGDFVDWGENTICGDAPGTWRTLSADEWEYLFEKRKNALQLRSKGSIDGHRGHILLPDDWVLPEGVQFVAEPDNLTMELDINTYTPAEWSIMEEAGAVFLPAAGRRDGTTVGYLVEYSGVWSSTSTTNTNAFHTYYNYDSQIIEHHWTSATSRINGRSVRLVHDTIVLEAEPEYVDLGLSVKWATFNVGATSPEDYGDYFAWGETETKETYSWANYKWCDGDYTKLNKYCTKEQYGMVDNQTILQLCDDAAHTKLGGNWRMPTMEECQELVNLCTWTWTTVNGINGHVITGPNGNTIFLPATGAITTSGLQHAGESGYYWINSISTTSPYNANDIYNRPPNTEMDGSLPTYGINAYSRYIGRPIRPVYDDRPPKRIGVFSVAADKQVSFSQGNLQYVQSTDTWQFAREQYELIGEDYTTLGIWDLFGWSGKDNNAPFGVSESANVVDYRGEFVDWGKNRIGNDAPATWRTLSREEWQYLIEIRPKADELYGVAMVAGVQGMILLPDDWVCPEGIIFNHGCHAKDNVENFAKHQTFSQEQWSIMEEAGAIFLPAAGIIYPPSKTITSVAGGAHYYSSDQKDADNAIFFGFRSSYYTINSSANRIRRSVRLVHDTIVPKPPKRIGVFSVAADKQVSFSQGNLQYTQSTDTWQFAREQYEYIGAENIKDGALADKIDLFGWSGKDSKVPYGVGVSSNYKDYQGEFVDWGTKLIHGDAKDTWRTLSIEEWEYIYHGRKNADQLLAIATLEGVPGLILLPDNWQQPEDIPFVSSVEQGLAWDATRVEGSYFDASNKDHTKDNIYTQAQWQKMEALGAVFLPCAGWRQGKTWLFAYNGEIKSKYLGSYWSCTIPQTSGDYYFFRFTQQEIRKYSFNSSANPSSLLARGRSVRLVHDTIVPETIPEPCLIVKVNDTLSINMMCVEGGTFMMGAMEGDTQVYDNEKPAHEVTLTYNYYIAQTEVTQALWKAVMGNNPSTMIGDDLPVNNVLWEEADAFVKRLSQMTGYTFHLPTEAEWEFAARGGNKSQGYLYAGSNNIQEVAWYGSNSGNTTQPVGTKQPNELGIYDMSGNVIEWCSDWLGPYSAEAQVNPIGPATGAYHVYCGGCWYLPANVCRCTHRRQTTAGYGEAVVGFRVALREKVEPEAIDLGLSVKWANFNVGAFHPTHCGDYFAWGETEPKETYSWATYKWCDGTESNITKYNTADGKTILEPEDDAAQVHWGGNWRMPTKEELQELIDSCQWERVTLNSVIGNKITGPNGNSIFIPAAGSYNSFDNQLHSVGSTGWLYSSSAVSNTSAREISIGYSGAQSTSCSKCVGLTIRPVYDDRPKSKIIWYTDEAIKEGSSVCLLNMAGWAYLHPEGMETTELNRLYQGKRINCIRLQVARAGTFTVSVANRDRLDSIFNIQTIMLKDPSKEPQVYHLPQTIHLQTNQVLVFSSPTDQGKFYYTHNGDITFADYVGHPDMKVRIADGPKTLNIDAGYYCEDRDNCDTTAIPEPPEL